MSAGIARGQTCRIKPYDLVIHAVGPGLAFLDQLRLKTTISVTGDINWDRTIIAL